MFSTIIQTKTRKTHTCVCKNKKNNALMNVFDVFVKKTHKNLILLNLKTPSIEKKDSISVYFKNFM